MVSRSVLVSGCSSGIGRATAQRLARAGWPVYASARRVESIYDRWVSRVPVLGQINLVVSDMAATLEFYRRLGWNVETPGSEHAVAELPNGVRVEFDSTDFASVWDSGYTGGSGGTTVLGLAVESREAVDELFADLVAHGRHGRQPPYDTFWGSRYAIVDDPDGNPVGLMSPGEESRRFWPPSAPPRAPSS